jgi:hypothetical protein
MCLAFAACSQNEPPPRGIRRVMSLFGSIFVIGWFIAELLIRGLLRWFADRMPARPVSLGRRAARRRI